MNKKPNTASALAGIIAAKRGNSEAAEQTPPEASASPVPEPVTPPSPAPVATPALPVPSPAKSGKTGPLAHSSDPTKKQFSVYLRKDTRKKISRLLEDLDSEMDFSDLTQMLLEQWIKSNT